MFRDYIIIPKVYFDSISCKKKIAIIYYRKPSDINNNINDIKKSDEKFKNKFSF